MLFAGVEITARIDGNGADGEKLTGQASAGAEAADFRERVALEHDDFLVVAVGDEHVALLRIVRERDVPHGSPRRHDAELTSDRGAFRVPRHDAFFDEPAVLLEHLNPITRAIADVHHPVFCNVDAGHVAELPYRRSGRIVRAAAFRRRFLTVRAPVPFVRTGLRIEDDDPVIPTVGDEDLVRGRVHGDSSRPVQGRVAVRTLHLAGRTDLQQEFSILCELEHMRIGRTSWCGRTAAAAPGSGASGCVSASCGPFCATARGIRCAASRATAARSSDRIGIGGASSAAASSGRRVDTRRSDPHVALRVNGKRPRRLRPLVALPRPAEGRQDPACGIELQNERRGDAAQRGGRWIRHHAFLVAFERIGSAMRDPHVILRIHGHASDRSEHPVIRQRLRPQRHDTVGRALRATRDSGEHDEGGRGDETALHSSHPPCGCERTAGMSSRGVYSEEEASARNRVRGPTPGSAP